MTIALYPDAFDPPTFGQLDIARRAAALFDEVVVAVDGAPAKGRLLPVERRVALLRESFKGEPSLRVECFEGLAAEFARQIGAVAIVCELRVVSDLDGELQRAMASRRLVPGVEVLCLMSAPEYTYVTSQIVREVALLGGDITPFVPPHVVVALDEDT